MTRPPALPTGYQLIKLDNAASTNAHARRIGHAQGGDGPAVTVVWAARQSAGRGRRGRVWVSLPGNLFCSLLLRTHKGALESAQLGFAAGLAAVAAMAGFAPPALAVTCKWPNDILLDGKKAGGILLEAEGAGGAHLDFLIIGIGLNLAAHPEETMFPATSLAACGGQASPGEMLAALCASFDDWFGRWSAEGFAPLRQAWLERAHGVGGPVTIDSGGENLTGIFADLDEDGALILETAGGRRSITAGDVYFAEEGPSCS